MVESGALFFILFGLFLFLTFRKLFKSSNNSRKTYNSDNRTEYQSQIVKANDSSRDVINVLTMNERKEIIIKMIRYRLDIKNDGDSYKLSQILPSLSMLEIMGMAEATIFNIIYPYLKRVKQGKSESLIIEELEKEDNDYSTNNLSDYPISLKEYISYKIYQDFGPESKSYFSPLYDKYISIIKTEIKY